MEDKTCDICDSKMRIIKTTGKEYTYKCFTCGDVKVVLKYEKHKRWWEIWRY